MTAQNDNAMNNDIGGNDWTSMFAYRVYRYFNRSDNRLYNPNDLYRSVVYISLALSLIVPGACFVGFVYPTAVDYATTKAQLASIPMLKRQIAQLDKMYRSTHITLTELETDFPPASLDNATLHHNAIDLHRMAHNHRLRIVATNTINDHRVMPRFTEYFTTTHYSWHLQGRFTDYLRFKKALWKASPSTQMEREHLSTRDDRQLDIVVDLSVYQPVKVNL